MELHGDRDLKLTINQGVCGEAARTQRIHFADLTVVHPSSYNLSKSQLEKTKDLIFVMSCPILELDFDTLRSTKRVIGAVNFDSKSVGSERILKDSVLLKQTYDKIKRLSDLCSLLF